MRVIELDASRWSTVLDFYDALLEALGAPTWHGRSINALVDSMIFGKINGIEAPYTVRIRNGAELPDGVRHEIQLAKHALAEARVDRRTRTGEDVDVTLEMLA